MLSSVMNTSRREHLTNEQLYIYIVCGGISKISISILMQRLRFAGHCWRSKYKLASDLILWQPCHGMRTKINHRYKSSIFLYIDAINTYIDQLRYDTNLRTIYEMKIAIDDREGWTNHVMDYLAILIW